MILVGLISGTHEPSLNINSYLTPLVLEQKHFYEGALILFLVGFLKLSN